MSSNVSRMTLMGLTANTIETSFACGSLSVETFWCAVVCRILSRIVRVRVGQTIGWVDREVSPRFLGTLRMSTATGFVTNIAQCAFSVTLARVSTSHSIYAMR